jgi:RNA polymerase sigma-70 factor (ECF subfamily)
MNDLADRLSGPLVSRSHGSFDAAAQGQGGLAQEFEGRLRDSGTLAFRVAFAVLRHREDAEDVAQESIARAYRSFSQLRNRERFRAWLVRMTWRMALDRRRGDRRRLEREQIAVPEGPPSAEALALERQRAAGLWNAIDTLPEKLRLVVVLSGIEGHDTREVAALLRIPEGTVRSRLFLARKSLAEKLQWLATET